MLFFFIVTLPVLYLVLPHWALTTFLVFTFVASLSIGCRPVLRPGLLWTSIGLLIGVNIWVARTSLGTVGGWQLLLGGDQPDRAAGRVRGRQPLRAGRHAAAARRRGSRCSWPVYDLTFSVVIPLTPLLADAFIGYPLDPSIGMRFGIYNANIGIGDLLVYALYTIAALKAYGPAAWRAAFAVVVVFGSLGPGLAPLVLDAVTRGNNNFVVPAQTFFGIPGLIVFLLLRRRYGTERTMRQFLASADVRVPIGQAEPVPAVVPAAPVPPDRTPVG